jgi:hypothetical protein
MLPTYLKRPDGSVFINPAKRHCKPYSLLTNPAMVTLQALGGSPPTTMPIDTQGHFEAFYAICDRTGPATITIYDPGRQNFLMNREIHMDTIVSGLSGAGGQRPFIWPESYFMNVEDAGRAFVVQFRDLSNGVNDIRFMLEGRRFYTKESPPDVYAKMYEYFGKKERTNVYFLTTDQDITLPAAGAPTETNAFARVTDEADFEIFKICSVSDGPFEYNLRDTGTGRLLSNGWHTNTMRSGTAEFPFIFIEPLLVERNYQLQITFRNLSGVANRVWFTMIGRRLSYAQ